ncbi:myrcene synthase, chloroplastic-like [Dendrobium catenatum]|uniref:myrcene synthase, chloroplastic-like n=1 Tax=Dendrobium catenatum TaxID=906689 RepID=UPI0010A02F0A|nr:myrcene synthase, chloroplastic-like [Dendrobium catenatum]
MEGDLQSSPPSRRSANYQPTLWDDSYIQSLPDSSLDAAQVNLWEKLNEEVRHLIDHTKQKDIIELLEEDFLVRSFKNENGSFKVHIVNDVKGMLSLYEASYLSVEGEDDLDEAMEFTTKHLSNYLKEPLLIHPSLVEQISHALELPLHWRMPRLHTRWFIDAYERQENMNHSLLEFAKLDFNMVQSICKKEVKEMSSWWRSIGLAGDEFSFARDRLMENYFWTMGCTFEPHFWRCRKEITKWKITEIQSLPNCMRKALLAIINTMNDTACAFSKEKGLDILPQLKQAWGDQCKAYLVEAIWYNTRYIPTLNEYMENAWLSVAISLVINAAYLLSEDLTKEALNSLEFYFDVTRYSSMVTRLYDDLGTSTDELQRGDVPKSIQCYMNETNVSEFVARDHIRQLIKKYWRLFNGEYFSNFNLEESFKRYALNLPRMAQCIYQYGDGYGKPDRETRDKIISSLIKPIPL